MKFNIVRLLIILLIIFVIDLYVFQAIRTVTAGLAATPRRWIYIVYWLFTAIAFAVIIGASIKDWHTWPRMLRTYGFAIIVVFTVSKIIVLPFLLIDDIFRLGRWLFFKIQYAPSDVANEAGLKINRSQFLMGAGLILAAIPFSSLTIGMITGPYNFKVRKRRLKFKNLPPAFDGLRILQISDFHTGSWSGPEPMERAVKLIKAQKADIILFTGDLVNDMGEEAFRFKDQLSSLSAPMGVFSSLGNHDYGDYVQWENEADRRHNFNRLLEAHKVIGWKLLRNENVILQRGNDKIALAGSENWGKGFQQYGDLDLTYKGLESNIFTILMSHDPSHWEEKVLPHPHKADLMLAGHTHGMQFGVDFKWFRWSPVQYRYKQWADLYQQDDKYLYVNRGIGFIGYPGRVGIMPEITVLELKRI